MATQTYPTLGSNLVEIENLDKLEIEQKINEHGKLYLSCIVKEAKADIMDYWNNYYGRLDFINNYNIDLDKEAILKLLKNRLEQNDLTISVNDKNFEERAKQVWEESLYE